MVCVRVCVCVIIQGDIMGQLTFAKNSCCQGGEIFHFSPSSVILGKRNPDNLVRRNRPLKNKSRL